MFMYIIVTNALKQRFSTWGTCTPGGTREARGGTQNVKFTDNISLYLAWGYANTNRLRTPALKHHPVTPNKNKFSIFVVYH